MKKFYGLLLCLAIATLAWFLGKIFPLVGAPIFAIVFGMIGHILIPNKAPFSAGITFSTKTILQLAVILLGFGLNISTVIKVGTSVLPVIISTIIGALGCAFLVAKMLHIPTKIATLIGVGTSICGGSAIAATAPVIAAEDEEVAQAISVIFFFNVLAIFIFPLLGEWLNFSHNGFAIFAGTAVNDTSSVTAVSSLWDLTHQTGTTVLDTATVVKLTRTLAIIPITLSLSLMHNTTTGASTKKGAKFPKFILYFMIASLLTSVISVLPLATSQHKIIKLIFSFLKESSKFLIVVAMAGIGLNTNLLKLVKTGKSALLLGLLCWITVILLSIFAQLMFNLV